MNLSRKVLLLSLVLGVALLSTSLVSAQRRRNPEKPPLKIDVSAIDSDGLMAVLKRDTTKNRPLLVNFWATWCDPCRDEFPDLVKIDKQYRPKGLDFTAVSLDDMAELKTSVPKFLSEMQVTVPTYLLNVSDPEEAITKIDPQWSGALPATFLYDAQGNLVYKRLGRVKVPELTAEIEKLIGNKNAAPELN